MLRIRFLNTKTFLTKSACEVHVHCMFVYVCGMSITVKDKLVTDFTLYMFDNVGVDTFFMFCVWHQRTHNHTHIDTHTHIHTPTQGCTQRKNNWKPQIHCNGLTRDPTQFPHKFASEHAPAHAVTQCKLLYSFATIHVAFVTIATAQKYHHSLIYSTNQLRQILAMNKTNHHIR